MRKNPRLSNWDYRTPGSYFLTFCTRNRYPLLGCVEFANDGSADAIMSYTTIGEACVRAVDIVATRLHGYVEASVVMPNHVHLLVAIEYSSGLCLPKTSPLAWCVSQVKASATRAARADGMRDPVWQRGFHDHIVRNEADHARILEYIANNPKKWALDRYYVS